MIFKECFAAIDMHRRVTALSGHLVAEDEAVSVYPVLSIRAIVPETDVVVGETTSTRAGEFLLEVSVPTPVSLNLQVMDADRTVLAESTVAVREAAQAAAIRVSRTVLAGATPIDCDQRDPPLLRHDSLEALRSRVTTLVAEGVLDKDAPEALESAIRPLAFADALMPDVRGVLAGHMESAERLRAALLSLGAPSSIPGVQEVRAGVHPHDTRETDCPDALRIID